MNPRILGAFLVGGVILGLAYFFAPTTAEKARIDASVSVVAGPAPEREAIKVTDTDEDGIPDWKEELRVVEPILVEVPEVTDTYTPPDTLTGTIGVDMLKGVLESKYKGSLGTNQEDILKSLQGEITEAASDSLYYEKHITIDSNSDNETLRIYGNKIAEIAALYEKPDYIDHELFWTREAVLAKDEEMLKELDPIIASLKAMRDAMLRTPVPEPVVKEHLDLTNTYNALYIDTLAFQDSFIDPMKSVARSRRYIDDAFGLKNALTNLYSKLVSYGVTWGPDEPTSSLIKVQ